MLVPNLKYINDILTGAYFDKIRVQVPVCMKPFSKENFYDVFRDLLIFCQKGVLKFVT